MQDMDEDWYQNRDKRTDGCTQVNNAYKSATVRVIITENLREHRVQLLTLFSIIMLAKWCRNIKLQLVDTPCLVENFNGNFSVFITKKVHAIDPFCHFNINEPLSWQQDIVLYIGNEVTEENDQYVTINGSGWYSACGYNKPAKLAITNDGPDVLGICFAACLANAALFRFLTRAVEKPYCKWYSLFSGEVNDTPFHSSKIAPHFQPELGRVHLIGCGAIGSSLVALLPYLQPTAQVLLVDPDVVEDHNTSSSMLFTYDDAKMNKEKIAVCKEYLYGFGISAELFKEDYARYAYQYHATDLNTPDLVLCFANENNIWSTIQNQYPPVCFHATTSKSWGIHIGRHIPMKENCLVCTFKDFIDSNFTPVCAEVNTHVTKEENRDAYHTAILPFLAPAAACICLAEILKFSKGSYQSENNTTFNMSIAEAVFMKERESFGHCYICASQTEIYQQLGPFSKFWHLSVG
jgi:hypothetical protein